MGSGPVELLLLDTHAWVWTMNGGPEQMSNAAREAIQRALSASALANSAISIWEVAMLESKGRLQLGKARMERVTESIRRASLRVLPLAPAAAGASTRLPGELHGDLADRIIGATVRHEGAILVTRDPYLLKYAARGYMRAIEA